MKFPLAATLAASMICAQTPPAAELRALGADAYTFAYPLVLMEVTRRSGPNGANQFRHNPRFPDAAFRQVIRPNADTLYSSAWLDLSKEPLLLHVPDTGGRYYLMHFMDAWTETFAVPGKRTTGAAEGWFGIAGPGWQGRLPERARRVDAPTNMVWLLGRTQTNGAADFENVRAIQSGFTLMPLSRYPDGPPAAPLAPRAAPPPAATPPQQVERMDSAAFFRLFTELLERNPPHAADGPMMRRLARIGLAPGKFQDLPGAAFEEGVESAKRRLSALDSRSGSPGPTGWTGGRGKVGRYGVDYTARAAVARIGLGALPPEDAVYLHCDVDASGNLLDGSRAYVMHFPKGQTPPVRAFWSLTMYSPDGYFVPNPVNRYAIGDRDPLRINADGSLDLYVQREAPGGEKDSNWLPAPAGKFNLSLRMYWPGEEVVNGGWTAPALRPVR